MSTDFYTGISKTSELIVKELIDTVKPKNGSILIVGFSSSEVVGSKIGQNSSEDVANAVFNSIYPITKKSNINLAVQCCEHLNRSIIMEEQIAIEHNYTIVNVIPQVKAGGAFATAAYHTFSSPVAVENVEADIGIDIGQTLIGMHLKSVAVPVRLSINKLGNAVVTCARTRPKFVGGSRAIYKEM